MASRKSYKLYSTATATASAAAEIILTKDCRLLTAQLQVAGVAGAATTGYGIANLSRQSVQTIGTNDTASDIAALSVAAPVNAGTFCQNTNANFGALGFLSGDRVYLHIYWTGQAPASCLWTVILIVEQ